MVGARGGSYENVWRCWVIEVTAGKTVPQDVLPHTPTVSTS